MIRTVLAGTKPVLSAIRRMHSLDFTLRFAKKPYVEYLPWLNLHCIFLHIERTFLQASKDSLQQQVFSTH